MAFEHRGWAVGRIGLPSLLAGVAILLALAAPAAQATFPGTNGKIAFSRIVPPCSAAQPICNSNIFTANPDGSGLTNLTNDATVDHQFPAWSPDGSRLVFSYRDVSDIWAMNADGSSPTPITQSQEFDFEATWSPDGRKIAFTSWRGGFGNSIFVMNADGSDITPLTSGTTGASEPSWSPDGTKIAYTSGFDDVEVFVMNADGTNQVNVSNDTSAKDRDPSWSPDGKKIAFTRAANAPPQNYDIYSMNADGSGKTRLTTSPYEDREAAWSPDGSKIVFSGYPDGFQVMNADGTGLTQIGLGGSTPDWQSLRPPGYARPVSATPTLVRLVPAYDPCTIPNGIHGGPLFAPSCNPPHQSSAYLTVGSADSNGKPANFTGYLNLKVLTESPIDLTNGDQSDVAFTGQITDVRDKQTLADYTGELRASFGLRLTDHLNGAGGVHAATVADTSFGFSFSCAATAEPPDIGSTCSVATTADAVMPGVTPEAKRAIWELGQVQVYDGGSDGDGDTTGDNTLFAVQGLFAP